MRAETLPMDVKQQAELTDDLFRLQQQVEAYSRLQAEEIEELRTKLRSLERRLTELAEAESASDLDAEYGQDDKEPIARPLVPNEGESS